jgi:hypothetical protein
MEAPFRHEEMNAPIIDRANNPEGSKKNDLTAGLSQRSTAETRRGADLVFFVSVIVLTAILCIIFWTLLNGF